MEATRLLPTRNLCSTSCWPSQRRRRSSPSSSIVTSVLTPPADNRIALTDGSGLRPPEVSLGGYSDSWFDRVAINHLSQSVQAATGLRNSKSGYDSLVEAATAASKNFGALKQRELVIQALDKAFPRPILSLIKAMLPPSKFAREYFAVFTTLFFAWLVGPCEVRESELNGRREKNVVHINKCRFLEKTNCVGLCSNLCKVPSQTFIKESLGMSVNMVPNFEDMSCQMIFGQDPPALMDDPAFKQPCYKLCKAKQRHNTKCPT